MIRLLTALACAGIMVGCTTVHLTVIVPPPQEDSLVAQELTPWWVERIPHTVVDTLAWDMTTLEITPGVTWDSLLVPILDEWIIDTSTLVPDTVLHWIDL